MTLFNPPDSTDSRAIDVTATITDVRATCADSGNDVVSTATFTVVALRRDAGPARQVRPALFRRRAAGRKQGGRQADRPGGAQFPGRRPARLDPGPGDGPRQPRRATLPANVRQTLTRPRKAGDPEAAVDPMSDPAVRTAVANATFEHLVGFQLTQDQLATTRRVRLGAIASRPRAARHRRVSRRKAARESRCTDSRRRRSNRPRNLSGPRTARA